MAAHNMVNILRAQLEKQERPLYLQPVDKDGNYPWKKREDESASSPKDAPGPSQQAGSSSGGASRPSCKRKTTEGGNTDEKGSKRVKATVTKRKATATKQKVTTIKRKATAIKYSNHGTQGQGSNCGSEEPTSTKDVTSTLETDS